MHARNHGMIVFAALVLSVVAYVAARSYQTHALKERTQLAVARANDALKPFHASISYRGITTSGLPLPHTIQLDGAAFTVSGTLHPMGALPAVQSANLFSATCVDQLELTLNWARTHATGNGCQRVRTEVGTLHHIAVFSKPPAFDLQTDTALDLLPQRMNMLGTPQSQGIHVQFAYDDSGVQLSHEPDMKKSVQTDSSHITFSLRQDDPKRVDYATVLNVRGIDYGAGAVSRMASYAPLQSPTLNQATNYLAKLYQAMGKTDMIVNAKMAYTDPREATLNVERAGIGNGAIAVEFSGNAARSAAHPAGTGTGEIQFCNFRYLMYAATHETMLTQLVPMIAAMPMQPSQREEVMRSTYAGVIQASTALEQWLSTLGTLSGNRKEVLTVAFGSNDGGVTVGGKPLDEITSTFAQTFGPLMHQRQPPAGARVVVPVVQAK